jgi:hypothetical protein
MKKIKNRILPQDDSQEATVLEHLRRGLPISNMRAVHSYSICRLSAVIDRLRAKNWNIQTVIVTTESGRVYGEYKLVK